MAEIAENHAPTYDQAEQADQADQPTATAPKTYRVARTSAVWEGYGLDTKWHVLIDGLVVRYFWTKREATEWVQAQAAEDLFYEELAAQHDAECGAEHVTRGSDPWGMRCELPRGHVGQHTTPDAFGPETGAFSWGRA